MLEFTYEIERDEGSELLKLAPDIIISPFKSTTSYVEGPNSSGKTTLLHLIAIGCHGLHGKKEIPTSLREKLRDLTDNDDITFDIKVYDKASNLILRARKRDKKKNEIETFHDVDGSLQRISSDQFALHYELIYDIPENPGQRINLLANEVKDLQTTIDNSIGDFNYSLADTIKKIMAGRNPKNMKKLRLEIGGEKEGLKFKKQQVTVDVKRRDLLRKYVYSKFQEEYRLSSAEAKGKLEKFKAIPASKKKAKSSKKSAYTKAKNKADILIESLEQSYREAGKYLSVLFRSGQEKDWYNDIWLPFSFPDLREEHIFPARFDEVLESFIAKCDETFEANRKMGKKSEIYDELIRVLKNVDELKLEIPIVGNKIPEMIEAIKKINIGNVREARRATNADAARIALNKLRDTMWNLEGEHLKKLKGLKRDEKSEAGSVEDDTKYRRDLAALNLEYSGLSGAKNHYKKKCLEHEIQTDAYCNIMRDLDTKSQIERYLGSTEEQFLSEITQLDEDVRKSQKSHNYAKIILDRKIEELERLEKKKPHKYEAKRDIIEDRLQPHLRNLEVKMRKFNTHLSNYSEKKPLPKKENIPREYEVTKKYYECVSNYLGFKLGIIRHGPEGKEYAVKKVDLNKGVIKTESGKEIRIAPMGTGQSQATYLLTRLNRDYGKRKLIVMFDEISMMDRTSLQPVIDKINKFQKEGKLIIGLVVQRREGKPKITPLEEW